MSGGAFPDAGLRDAPPSRADQLVRNDDLTITTEQHAIVLPIVWGRRGLSMSGAVYDREGTLVPHSQRYARSRELTNPDTLEGRPSAFRVEGHSLFGGVLFRNFGHTLLESMSRLWCLSTMKQRPARLIYQASTPDVREMLARAGPNGYLSALLSAAGYSLDDVVLVVDEAAVCDELAVPQAAFTISEYAHPSFASFFDAVVDRLVPKGTIHRGSRRIYLSRSLLKGRKRRAENEGAIEQLAIEAGFEIVHPQTLPFEQQVALIREAGIVAGCDGSAMHLTIFARPGTRVICLDDTRPGNTQRVIESLRGLEGVRVPAIVGGRRKPGKLQTWTADLEAVRKGFSAYA